MIAPTAAQGKRSAEHVPLCLFHAIVTDLGGFQALELLDGERRDRHVDAPDLAVPRVNSSTNFRPDAPKWDVLREEDVSQGMPCLYP